MTPAATRNHPPPAPPPPRRRRHRRPVGLQRRRGLPVVSSSPLLFSSLGLGFPVEQSPRPDLDAWVRRPSCPPAFFPSSSSPGRGRHDGTCGEGRVRRRDRSDDLWAPLALAVLANIWCWLSRVGAPWRSLACSRVRNGPRAVVCLPWTLAIRAVLWCPALRKVTL